MIQHVQKSLKNGGALTVSLLLIVMCAQGTNAFAQTLDLSLPDLDGEVGDEITIAVEAANIADKGVAAYVIGITYDTSIIGNSFSANSTSGTISAGASISSFQADGEFRVIYARNITDPISEDGTLFSVTSEVVGQGTTNLEISSVSYMEGAIGTIDFTSSSGSFTTEVTNTDSDGISDEVESQVPNPDGGGTGDGNGDGTPDSEQANVASFVNETDESYMTLASVEGTALSNVSASGSIPSGLPSGATLPDGMVSFDLLDVDAGGAATVMVFTSHDVTGYFKYGPTPDNAEDHWYLFEYDGTTGAEIEDDVITLHLVDGGRGDSDLEANGSISDPGAPVFYTNLLPPAPEILSPASGTEVVIGGANGGDSGDPSSTLLTVDWDDVEDFDGDAVSYRVDASSAETFETMIESIDVSDASELAITVGQAADWFDDVHGDVQIGAELDIYLRVIATDGEAETASETRSLSFVRGTVTSIGQGELPDGFRLRGNYPNPFNPSTTIRFDLHESADVSVHVFDLLGRDVLSVPSSAMQAGSDRSIRLNAAELSSGTYVYRVTARTATDLTVRTGRMMVIK